LWHSFSTSSYIATGKTGGNATTIFYQEGLIQESPFWECLYMSPFNSKIRTLIGGVTMLMGAHTPLALLNPVLTLQDALCFNG
jgi:hypothetical protein